MAWLRKTISSCGRSVPKPEEPGTHEEFDDEAIPIQDQIENLRAKISLKEKYNKALQDEFRESNLGASVYIKDLSKETKVLRQKLMAALLSEKSAVQNALRTHRNFQLAMSNRAPVVAISWLDDKLFDMSKHLNTLFDKLKKKRKKLEEAEEMVIMIEKWPRPGTLPWELEATENFNRMGCLIEAAKVKKETAYIINSKYNDIKFHLRGERGKYHGILKNMESGLLTLKKELESLETMLDDAVHFKNEAYKNLVMSEKEASENRKKRRVQMNRMKKAVEKILESNLTRNVAVKNGPTDLSVEVGDDMLELLRAKKAEVEDFEGRSKRIVESMRVPDLTYIPDRLKVVVDIAKRLMKELDAKEKLKMLFLKQKQQLQLILNFFRYTGVGQLEEFNAFKKDYLENIGEAQARNRDLRDRLDTFGGIHLDLKLSLLSIIQKLTDPKKKSDFIGFDVSTQMKIIRQKIKELLEKIQQLESEFKLESERPYAIYVRPPPVPPRLIRVGTPAQSEESEGEDNLTDAKVPGRAEIKAQSARIIHQAMLKKGFR